LHHAGILSPKLCASNVSFGIRIAAIVKISLAKIAKLILNKRQISAQHELELKLSP
jgi:hypothetical protein